MNNTDSINDKPFHNDPACFQNAIIDTQYNDNACQRAEDNTVTRHDEGEHYSS